jgi:hypothetical protein
MDGKIIEYLKTRSVCKKFNTQMNFIEVPIERLENHARKLIKKNRLKYQVVNCPKCGSNGIHVY